MKTKELTCVVCPNGCPVAISWEEGPPIQIVELTGWDCEKGRDWAQLEILAPVRSIASSVLVVGGREPLASVRTDVPIPLDKIFAVMAEIRARNVSAPVHPGQVILTDPAGTACRIIATRGVDRAPTRKG